MAGRMPPEQYPWWVKFSLVGAKSLDGSSRDVGMKR